MEHEPFALAAAAAEGLLTATAGRRPRAVVVLGLAAGQIPHRIEDDPLLSEAAAQRIAGSEFLIVIDTIPEVHYDWAPRSLSGGEDRHRPLAGHDCQLDPALEPFGAGRQIVPG